MPGFPAGGNSSAGHAACHTGGHDADLDTGGHDTGGHDADLDTGGHDTVRHEATAAAGAAELREVAEGSLSVRGRLPADDRRRQLVGLGLRMLVEVPIQELSVDRVAAAAGISRSLLFHYFPSKRDFHVAVVRAAARRLLRACEPSAGVPPDVALTEMLTGYVRFIERRREPYLALFRGTAGGADYVRDVYEETRQVFTARALNALQLSGPTPPGGSPSALDSPLVALAVRGWFCFVEDAVLSWTVDTPVDRDELVRMLVRSLGSLVATARS